MDGPVGLGHCRLSIIDLSSGQQPLTNEDGSIVIVFNGEIYNYRELREQLIAHGHVFKTKSDTEVIVHLYEQAGASCLDSLRGMFAFAIWDDRKKTLFLARDRLGIKPLYYALTKDTLWFASEIKAILADPEANTELRADIIDRFLSFDYVPGDETLFRNIYKLPPGHYMLARNGKAEIKQYWDLQFTHLDCTFTEAKKRTVEMLEEAVRLHMISDVPVGFLLSGGIDSSAMLSFGAGATEHPVSSYTLGFSAPNITDERPYARLAAEKVGSQHHEMTITAGDFQRFLPEYVWHMEEPVCEPPAVALYYVSKLAKSFVKVLISGEGGDEAFAGYPNYRNMLWLERTKKLAGSLNGALSKLLAQANGMVKSPQLQRYIPLVTTPFSSYYYSRTSTPFRFFNSRTAGFYSPEFSNVVSKERSWSVVKDHLRNANHNGVNGDLVNRMLYVDTKTWLPDDLLLKADKMTMANSIELRVPLLDHKLIEFAASLPGKYKVRGLTTKYIAKKSLAGRIPDEILYRKKTGFPVPYGSWLRRELKDWVWALLLDSKTVSRGYFNKNAVENLLKEDSQTGGYSKEIFCLATLELWHRAFLPA